MTNAWGGANPTAFSEPGVDYELGVRYLINNDLNVTAIRIYSAVVSANFAGRNAYIRTTSDVILATVDMPDVLAIGWNTVALGTPLNLSPGTTVWTTYPTITDYATISNAFPQNSSDNSVTANSGGFHNNPGNLPNNLTTTFYGIDFVFDVINHFPPTVTMAVSVNDLDVSALIAIDDDHPETVTYKIDWGDNSSSNVGSSLGPHLHSYATGGLYAAMVTATDADTNVDAFAVALNLSTPSGTDISEDWIDPILDAIVSDAQMSGYFDMVNTHEPKRKPGTGLTAAVWCDRIECVGAASGLSVTSARVVFMLRIYSNMLQEPQDYIDPELMRATSNLIRRYHDDFDFAGAIRNVDLLGQYGQGLFAQAGYLLIDNALFRVMDLAIPCIVNDVWPQIP